MLQGMEAGACRKNPGGAGVARLGSGAESLESSEMSESLSLLSAPTLGCFCLIWLCLNLLEQSESVAVCLTLPRLPSRNLPSGRED